MTPSLCCAPGGRVDAPDSGGRAEDHELVTVRSEPSTVAIWVKRTTHILLVHLIEVGHG